MLIVFKLPSLRKASTGAKHVTFCLLKTRGTWEWSNGREGRRRRGEDAGQSSGYHAAGARGERLQGVVHYRVIPYCLLGKGRRNGFACLSKHTCKS